MDNSPSCHNTLCVLHAKYVNIFTGTEKMKQNITLSLDKDLIEKAKVISAKRNTSISKMLGEELQRVVESTENYERAKKKALSHLQTGYRLGGIITSSREDLHER